MEADAETEDGYPEDAAVNRSHSPSAVAMEIVNSPPARLKVECVTQTTPGLAKNGSSPPADTDLVDSKDDTDSDEEQSCPICFESWTNAGDHRLVSLPCGHLFGRNCVERWLKDQKTCPQCKKKCRSTDVRNIFARSVKALDTTESENAKRKMVEEQYKRSKAEEGEAKATLQLQLLKAEMEQLRQKVAEAEAKAEQASLRQQIAVPTCHAASSSNMIASQQSTQQMNKSTAAAPPQPSHPPLKQQYTLKKNLQVSQQDARVMAYDRRSMLMVVSKPSPNQQLFAGHGILKVSSLESRSSEYIPIHQSTIRDAKFNHSGDNLVLTASIDKTLKLTNTHDSTSVLSYKCPAPVWSCAWNETDTNFVYAGLQNGMCCFYDIRKLDSELSSMRPRFGVPCPIVSLSYVAPPSDETTPLRCEGLLVGTLQGGWFARKEDDDTFTDHQLILPEGSCTSLYFDPGSRHALLSQRPGKHSARTRHTILKLAGEGSGENLLRADVVRQVYGGNKAQSLTRSLLYTVADVPEPRMMIAAGDEASNMTFVWDGARGEELQRLPNSSRGSGPVFDVVSFEAYNAHFLATLTAQKLSFYSWK